MLGRLSPRALSGPCPTLSTSDSFSSPRDLFSRGERRQRQFSRLHSISKLVAAFYKFNPDFISAVVLPQQSYAGQSGEELNVSLCVQGFIYDIL